MLYFCGEKKHRVTCAFGPENWDSRGNMGIHIHVDKKYICGKRKEETLTDGIIIELRQDNKNARKRIKK